MNPLTKLTPADIDASIESVTYTRLPSGKAIVCEIVMLNGYAVHGISALVDLENYDEVMGKQAAFNKAKAEVWNCLAYQMQENIFTCVVPSRHAELTAAYRVENGHASKTI